MDYPVEIRPLAAWHITDKTGQRDTARQAVQSIEEAAAWLDAKARSEVDDDSVVWSAQGLEVWFDGDWEEWCDADGNDIDDYLDPDFVA